MALDRGGREDVLRQYDRNNPEAAAARARAQQEPDMGAFSATEAQQNALQKLGVVDADQRERLRILGEREADLRAQLMRRPEEYASAIDEQLRGRLQDLGYEADTARRGLGESLADRGLLRSTGLSKGLQDIALKEQAARSELQLGATQEKMRARQLGENTFRDIRQAQAEQQDRYQEAEAGQAHDVYLSTLHQDIKTQAELDMANVALRSADKQRTLGFIGDIVGGITKGLTFGLLK